MQRQQGYSPGLSHESQTQVCSYHGDLPRRTHRYLRRTAQNCAPTCLLHAVLLPHSSPPGRPLQPPGQKSGCPSSLLVSNGHQTITTVSVVVRLLSRTSAGVVTLTGVPGMLLPLTLESRCIWKPCYPHTQPPPAPGGLPGTGAGQAA